MSAARKTDLVRKLLKGIETGDPGAAAVVNEAKYIQHNPRTSTGSEGLAALFQRLSKTDPKVEIVRAFEDGDFVWAHTDYRFQTHEVGFEVFRFEDGLAVEHWDNLQERRGPNPSGRAMLDGPTAAAGSEHTEATRGLVRSFSREVLLGRRHDRVGHYVADDLVQHDWRLPDGIDAVRAELKEPGLKYDRVHRVLAEGDYALVICEGSRAGTHSSIFHMYRVDTERRLIVEHWTTEESVAPRSEWKNENGKFRGLAAEP